MGLIEGDHFDDEQCLAQLGRAQFGRIALTLQAVPVVVPVRYALSDGGTILFTVSVDQLREALHGTVTTLQADGFDEASGRRWSVIAVGTTRRVEVSDGIGLREIASLSVPDATAVEQDTVFRLDHQILSGRWLDTL